MAHFDWVLPLDPDDPHPRYLQIARTISDAIVRGRLLAGSRLPGTRTLAEQLGVQRNTVVAAYDELQSEGWIETRPKQGTFVTDDIPESTAARPTETKTQIGFRLPRRADTPTRPKYPRDIPPGALALSGGIPDIRLVPIAALGRAYQRALKSRGRKLLSYGNPKGHSELRNALAQMIAAERGVPATEERVLVTRGSQMGFDLVARALIAPGDRVAVEAYGYPPAWATFRAAGAELVPIEVDLDGVQVDRLERRISQKPIRALYVTPHHQYPTMAGLAPARRMALLELARRHRFAIIEDDYDHEIHYSGQPILPLASNDPHGVVVYVSTLSKTLAPGLRLGYVVAPPPFIDRLAEVRCYVDRQGDQVLEHAVAELFEDGEVQRHVRRTRKIYKGRRAHFKALLETHLSDVLSFELPAGGLALWPYVEPAIDPEAWVTRARREGVIFIPGQELDFKGRRQPHIRIGFAALDESELETAVLRMKRALPG